jgi:multidrug efflux system membrane fusion protein
VAASSTVALKSQVGGPIRQAHFTEGQEVAAGQLLFSIDPAPYEAALRKAEANLLRDQALARNAEAEAARYEELVKKDYVTRQQYDLAKAQAEALQATLQADAAAVAEARLNLGYCTIRSPLDGRTGQLLVHPGNIVKANETSLVEIARIRPIFVGFSVPEQRLPELRRAMARGRLAVRVTIPDGAVLPEEGTLSFLDNAVAEATGTIRLKATFANPAGLLWPGQFVTVDLVLDVERGAVMAPAAAIQTGQEGQYAFVIDSKGKARQRAVTTGRGVDGLVLVRSGLSPGERVVTDGQLRLVDGAEVEIKAGVDAPPPPAAAASPAAAAGTPAPGTPR